jgi:hypothetical protein
MANKQSFTPEEWTTLLESTMSDRHSGGAPQALCRCQTSRRGSTRARQSSGGFGHLDAKAPGDAPAFKTWLRAISQKVAEASAEGGFLGIGGVQISDAEKATLADISHALGTTA